MAEEPDGVWRTIRGRRVFIKKGQSLHEAMRESGKFKNLKKEEKAIEKTEGNLGNEKSKKYTGKGNDMQRSRR